MTTLLRSAALRTIERRAAARLGEGVLMRRAGEAAARVATTMTLARPGPVLVLAGPGNNGGDARVAARALEALGFAVRVAELDGDDVVAATLANATLVVDGLFGIGLKRAPDGRARAWIEAVNAAAIPVLALDVPSGIDADTGRVLDVAIDATRTITFIADKPGLHTGAGVDRAGDVVVDALGLVADDLAADGPAAVGATNDPSLFASSLRPRTRDSHKGTFGSVAVIGGNAGMAGAALLAARAALQAGAGRVYVQRVGDDAPRFDVVHPELMFRDDLDGVDPTAAAVGSGLGDDARATALLGRWLEASCPLVLDADALNAVARDDALAERVRARGAATIVTPHPLEAARLLGTDARGVAADRIGAACDLAARLSAIVVLKGAGTIVASTTGEWVVNPTGNAGLATGGTGDVLCGLVAALVGQRVEPLAAARAAVWLHGRAADDLVAAGTGPIGLTASELVPAIRGALNRLVQPPNP